MMIGWYGICGYKARETWVSTVGRQVSSDQSPCVMGQSGSKDIILQ